MNYSFKFYTVRFFHFLFLSMSKHNVLVRASLKRLSLLPFL